MDAFKKPVTGRVVCSCVTSAKWARLPETLAGHAVESNIPGDTEQGWREGRRERRRRGRDGGTERDGVGWKEWERQGRRRGGVRRGGGGVSGGFTFRATRRVTHSTLRAAGAGPSPNPTARRVSGRRPGRAAR